ncbi:MAG TPA: hypothetical protein VK966_00165 [Longimicrobiales bacterium]|nr:hypothetical protein [Longimicrobiales bacterium]
MTTRHTVRAFLTGSLLGMAMAVLSGGVTTALAAQTPEPELRIQATLDQAREAGLPVELLESKVAEGHAKRIPMDRIANAVEQRANALERARTVLSTVVDGAPVPVEDMAVGADAIQAGVADMVLAQIASTAGGQRRTVAIAALTQLLAEGVLPEEALGRVRSALQRGDAALMNLPAGAAAGAAGGPPAGVPGTGRPAGAGKPTRPPGNGKGPPNG